MSALADEKALNAELLSYIKTLEAALNEKDFMLESAQKDLESYKSKLQSAVDIVDDVTAKKAAATNLVSKNVNKQAELNEKISLLQGELLLIQSAHDSAHDKVKKAEGEVQILTSERDGLNKYVKELNISLEETKERALEEGRRYESVVSKSLHL